MSSRRRNHVAIRYEEHSKSETKDGPSARDGEEKCKPSRVVAFSTVALLPEPADNCAIAKAEIDPGTLVEIPATIYDDRNGKESIVVAIKQRILEGHRFAIRQLPLGSKLLSWGLAFGIVVAKEGVGPGEALCNRRMLKSLQAWNISELPVKFNFDDYIEPYDVKKATVVDQVPLRSSEGKTHDLSFMGFPRVKGRGCGTRNYIVIIGCTVRSSAFVTQLARSYRNVFKDLGLSSTGSGLSGVVPIAHTENGKGTNRDMLIRTLAQFVLHPNTGAALVIDRESVDVHIGSEVRKRLNSESKNILEDCNVAFETLGDDFSTTEKKCQKIIDKWCRELHQTCRKKCSLSNMCVALQCGGSDAFSGVSGNPTAGWAVKKIIEHGGRGILAETDELIGAESYVLKRVKSIKVAEDFQRYVQRFKERMSWHGQTAEANPSGGNNLRGLYNIALKSLGAAKKKHADVRLDGVLEYGQALSPDERGYFFMDSPGNDLESIAGQVACGSNMIIFITGNGSITNFPFVPTLKVITTSRRYNLLSKDMDFNAGRFQEGISLSDLGDELVSALCESASGKLSKGELANHSQVSIWRAWAQEAHMTKKSLELAVNHLIEERVGKPLKIKFEKKEGKVESKNLLNEQEFEKIGLIFPTSLCSGQIARIIADKLNVQLKQSSGRGPLGKNFHRFVALPHSEGCGMGYAFGEEKIFERIVTGHVTHPRVSACLLLEHGCEKTHNSVIRKYLESMQEAETNAQNNSIAWDRIGFLSVQRDGGIDRVTKKAIEFFLNIKTPKDLSTAIGKSSVLTTSMETWRPCISITTSFSPKQLMELKKRKGSKLISRLGSYMGSLVRMFVSRSYHVLVPSSSSLWTIATFVDCLLESVNSTAPTLGFAQKLAYTQKCLEGKANSTMLPSRFSRLGGSLHIVACPPKADWAEILTGFAASGCVAAVCFSDTPLTAHPFVPVLRLCEESIESKKEDEQRLQVEGDAYHNLRETASGLRVSLSLDIMVDPGRATNIVEEVVRTQLLSIDKSEQRSVEMKDVLFQIPRGVTGISA